MLFRTPSPVNASADDNNHTAKDACKESSLLQSHGVSGGYYKRIWFKLIYHIKKFLWLLQVSSSSGVRIEVPIHLTSAVSLTDENEVTATPKQSVQMCGNANNVKPNNYHLRPRAGNSYLRCKSTTFNNNKSESKNRISKLRKIAFSRYVRKRYNFCVSSEKTQSSIKLISITNTNDSFGNNNAEKLADAQIFSPESNCYEFTNNREKYSDKALTTNSRIEYNKTVASSYCNIELTCQFAKNKSEGDSLEVKPQCTTYKLDVPITLNHTPNQLHLCHRQCNQSSISNECEGHSETHKNINPSMAICKRHIFDLHNKTFKCVQNNDLNYQENLNKHFSNLHLNSKSNITGDSQTVAYCKDTLLNSKTKLGIVTNTCCENPRSSLQFNNWKFDSDMIRKTATIYTEFDFSSKKIHKKLPFYSDVIKNDTNKCFENPKSEIDFENIRMANKTDILQDTIKNSSKNFVSSLCTENTDKTSKFGFDNVAKTDSCSSEVKTLPEMVSKSPFPEPEDISSEKASKNKLNSENIIPNLPKEPDLVKDAAKCCFGWFRMYGDPMFVVITTTMSLHTFVVVCMITIIEDFAKDLHVPENKVHCVLMALSIADLLGALTLGAITDRKFMSRRCFVVLCFLGASICIVSISRARTLPALLALISFYGLFETGVIITLPLLIAQYVEDKKQAVALAASNILSSPTVLLVPLVIGFFRDRVGCYSGVFYVLAITSFSSSVIWLVAPYIIHKYRSSKASTCEPNKNV